MPQERVQIDPQQFAEQFLSTLNIDVQPRDQDLESAAKQALAAYLSAYFLAERFNSTENTFFVDKGNQGIKSSYQRILSELNDY
ncbi:hypothetical protein [Schleiferilactobacillus shenzhenensis]|uniref:Uncharacterized protein n=1 Tax=Schleiferilactobacillus shenzhenensis LY-73 TaxID=1231336 RepID=U4TJP1_9LACO|nr:hypothetical protein [Schleiferilactobacillus shenzhenensis]ERL65051.1 hypothetical protein L248_2989 [Schleiferilactobacillus shenzhenensis LY-73]